MNPLASPGQTYYDPSGYPSFAAPPPMQQYYSSPAPGSAMSASAQPSLSSFGASGELSSQQTSSAADGSNGEIVYGSDGSPATSQEMLAIQQSQHFAAIQQQQRAAPPYISYMPDPSAAYPYGAPQAYGSTSFPPSAPQDYSGYQYPISSHSQQPHPQQQAPSFSHLQQQQQPGSPYSIPPPPLSPQQSHAQPPYASPYRYYPPAPLPYGAYPSPIPPPPPFATPGSPLSPPQVYSPPPELARGQLAQSKFHEAVFGGERDGGYSHGGPGGARDGRRGSAGGFGMGGGGGGGFGGRALPKPPAHSPHALWVGNVPSDATHPELWRFFSSRPVPAASPKYANMHPADIPPGVDLNSTGIESIHLISRSNCAFVNYASDIHLQHSIAVSNGLPLRPHDPRCKDLVCRVRKRDEDAKSGVGAQRIGGMHKDFVREKERERREGEKAEGAEGEEGKERPPQRYSTGSTSHSISTTSTTSSFLAKHFEKRYFILKSHDEGDLKLSIDRGLWATQLHNEPVLDQAFHTAKDVFLIFGANRSGAFAGYARMTSSIHQNANSGSSGENRISWTSRSSDEPPASAGSLSSPSYSTGIPATIHEEDGTTTSNGLPRLFSPSEQRLAETSPQPLTPGGTKLPSGSAPATLSSAARREFLGEAERVAMEEAEFSLANLHLPDGVGRGESLDPKLLTRRERDGAGGGDGVPQAVKDQQAVGASSKPGETDGDGVWRKDQLPTPAERNARLERMGDGINGGDKGARDVSAEWGRPFRVEWIKVARLPFSRTRHIKNQFNSGKEVKISRDGTELEPSAGESLIAEFWRDDITGGNDNGDSTTPPTHTQGGIEVSEESSADRQATPSGLVSARSSESS
ncbi:YT521-B-like domain-domain-containing protein [Leucosporidium creatinivorum]|uniref:YT521-B-like domain-domain-containing protein n=1 Tax=Leucosporidium creatinivorum TaxID=106004 RepID=A0A1Y2EPZ3_9BASI|nr:YT521-B-like domain-domain-containing protein [Leucosporidium creatinivorum]